MSNCFIICYFYLSLNKSLKREYLENYEKWKKKYINKNKNIETLEVKRKKVAAELGLGFHKY